jgi:hypothetical protein
MTDDQSSAKFAKIFRVLRTRALAVLGLDAGMAGHAPHEVPVTCQPGARALPSNQQWRTVAAMGGAAAIVIAIILGIAAILATRDVGLVK